MADLRAPARVGIVIRSKDRPHFLRRALDDVLGQRFDGWRIVIANDGGDRSVIDEVVDERRAALADRVVVVDVSPPNGRCAAANQGIAALDEDYVVLHDDDDRWHPDFLSATVAWLEANPDDVAVAVPIEIRYERERDGNWVERGSKVFLDGVEEIRFSDLVGTNRIVPIGLLYRRRLHDELGGYDESLDAVEDWEFYLRITLRHRIAVLPGRVLAYWVQRPEARGVEANSMFALGGAHRRDDARVRDAALRAWVAEHGAGVPLFLAGLVELEVARRVDEEFRRRSLLRRLARRVPGLSRLVWWRRRRG